MMPALDIDALLQPLPGDEPCGVSLIHDPEYEAIRTARRADDASVPAGIWQTTLKVADWPAVEAGCRRVLSNRSKDLTIAAWLGEAWLNRYGVAALPHCFQLMVGLCERYWDDLHPLPRDGDQGFRAAPFAWLAGAYADLLSAQIELFEGRDGLRGTLAQWQSAQRAARRAGGEAPGSRARDDGATGRGTGDFACASAARTRCARGGAPAHRAARCALYSEVGRRGPQFRPADGNDDSCSTCFDGVSNYASECPGAGPVAGWRYDRGGGGFRVGRQGRRPRRAAKPGRCVPAAGSDRRDARPCRCCCAN